MSEDFLRYGTDHSGNAVCSLCQKILSSDSDATGDLESISICGDCKFLFLEDLDTPSREPSRRRTTTRRRTTRHSSAESAENLFSQQFSHMISRVRQSQPTTVSGPEEIPVARTTATGSGRWRRVYSDTESDDAESVVSLRAISFTSYGSGSDDEASVDLDGSDFGTITDADNIDPMHAGLDHWNSDEEEEEEEEEWEEVEVEQQQLDAEGGTRRARNFLLANLEDHLDSGGLEEFLRHLAADEDDNEITRRGGAGGGAPPASASFVRSLPRVLVEEGAGDLTCAICKEALAGGAEASRLPCNHLYHTPCISPWLSSRNSCPLCRYELPTDDRDYEDGKRPRGRGRGRDRTPIADEDSSVTFSDREDGGEDETEVTGSAAATATAVTAGEGRRGGRWLFLAAAPIVGLVGIVLVLWLGNIGAEGRHVDGAQVQRHVQVIGSSGGGERESRSRRWWSFF